MPKLSALAQINVLHADAHLLVLDKPAGLLSVPGRGPDKQDCLSARVQADFPDALIVHRLDMATSGLVIMARGADAQRQLSRAFEQRQVGKRYEAVVNGLVQAPATADGWGVIDLPLIADWPNRPLRIVDAQRGQASTTRWRLRGFDTQANASRLELEPLTGRTHQLRVHLKALGHSILGDALYAPHAVRDAAPRLLLHATLLSLAHPATGQALAFHSPVPF